MSKGHGYRGYIGSRPYSGLDFPQNVQNFLIRSYCQKNNLTFLLSGTEYRMPGCYMILEEIIDTMDALEGIVVFSIYMLPESADKRKRLYETVLKAGKSLHAALEDMSIRQEADIQLFEDILRLNKIALKDSAMTQVQEFCFT